MSQLSHIHNHQAPTPEETRRVLSAQVNGTKALVEKAIKGMREQEKNIIENRKKLEEIIAICREKHSPVWDFENILNTTGDINVKCSEGYTILMLATYFGRIALTKLLLDHPDTLINEKDRKGDTALIGSAENILRIEETKLLLAHPRILINKGNNNGDTALIQASKGGNIEIVQALIKDPHLDFRKYNQGVRAIKKTKDQRIRKLIRAKMREQGIEF